MSEDGGAWEPDEAWLKQLAAWKKWATPKYVSEMTPEEFDDAYKMVKPMIDGRWE